MKDEKKGELIPRIGQDDIGALADRPNSQFSAFDVASGQGGLGAIAHNFTGDRNEQMKFLSKATAGDCQSGSDFIGRDFMFSHWFVHRIEVTNPKTGEVSEAPRIVLISPDGEAIQFVSNGVAQSLRMILSFIGTGQLNGGFRVTIKQTKTRAGYHIYYLQPNPVD